MRNLSEYNGIKYIRWTSPTPNMYFYNNQIYPIVTVDGDSLVVIDETEEKSFIEPEDLQWAEPVTDEEFKASRKIKQVDQHSVIPGVPAQRQAPVPNSPSIVDINLDQLPYWTQYITINNEGVWATSDPPEEVSKMKEKVTLETPIVIKIPKRKIPLEVLANLFKEGKITFPEFEAEMKITLGSL